ENTKRELDMYRPITLWPAATLALAILSITGCMVGPKYHQPTPPVPRQIKEGGSRIQAHRTSPTAIGGACSRTPSWLDWRAKLMLPTRTSNWLWRALSKPTRVRDTHALACFLR